MSAASSSARASPRSTTTRRPTTPPTFIARERSPLASIRSRSAFFTRTRKSPATKTCATPGRCARRPASRPASRPSSTNSRCGHSQRREDANQDDFDDASRAQAPIAFQGVGRRPDGQSDIGEDADLSPAAFAAYRDLDALRYDFPLVLTNDEGPAAVKSLSGVIDDVLKGIAVGGDSERLRRHAFRLEREVRRLVAEGGGSGLVDEARRGRARLGSRLRTTTFLPTASSGSKPR